MSLNQIAIAPIIPLWLILLLFGLGSLAAIIQYWLIRRRLGSSRAFIISILRLCALFLLLSISLHPHRVVKREYTLPRTLSILIDTSPSMGLPGSDGKGSRLDEAKRLLLEGSKPLLKSLSENYDLRLYALSQPLRPLKEEELPDLQPGRKRADLNETMGKLSGKTSLAILLSDGNMRWDPGQSKSPPLLIQPLGAPKEYRDILIKGVKAPSIAFRGREVTIDVTIKIYGYRGLTLPLILKDGNKLLTVRNIRIDESPREITLPLSFTPERVGEHHLFISIPSQSGESLTSNNDTHFSLKVVRDKIKILMISGSPSLNYRFMRMALKNDPSVDLLSFVILRTPSDILNVPIQEQSLIPIPVETLFTQELSYFDLLIFDNLPSHLYVRLKYYEAVRDFIKEGGGFAMIGGPHLLDGGRYAGTPIAEILPVKLTGQERYRRDASSGVRLSREGVKHPITRLSTSEEENLNLWREMSSLEGINILEPKSLKNVLLETNDGVSSPILFADRYGKGRVLILATDFFWKWHMGMVAKGKGNWAYFRFVERMTRWLTGDPGLDPVQIILPEKMAEAGEEMEFRINAGEEDLYPNLSLFDPAGIKMRFLLKKADQSGVYLASFFPEKGGSYKVKVETPAGGVEETIVIAGPDEGLDGAPDHERLRTISATTEGKVLSKGDDLLKEAEAYTGGMERRFTEEKKIPLWSIPFIFVLMVILLGLEWYLRRRGGLI